MRLVRGVLATIAVIVIAVGIVAVLNVMGQLFGLWFDIPLIIIVIDALILMFGSIE